MDFITIPLTSKHNKKDFSSSNVILNNYLKQQAKQDIKRKLSACFVLENKSNIPEIIGYYTLSNNSINQDEIPSEISRKLPMSYKNLPVTLMGRLAIDEKFKQKGFGKLLLIDALKRSLEVSKTIGSFAFVVDPIDDIAVNFYQHFGFILLPNSGKMFLPMKTVEKLFT